MSREVLVVGATGHVGSQAAKALARSGWSVRALVRTADKRIHGADDLPITTVVGDLTDRGSIDRAMDGVAAVLSTANSIIPDANPTSVDALNEVAGDVLVDAAVRHGVERFVQSSVPTHDWGDRKVPELRGKRRIEDALAASPLSYTVVRNPAFTDVWLVMCGLEQAENGDPHATTRRPYGFMRTWRKMTGNLAVGRGRLIAPGGPDHGSPLVTARDVALGLAAAVDAPFAERATLEFGGPEWLTWAEVAELVGERIGRDVSPLAMPAWFANVGRAATRPVAGSASNVLALTTLVAKHQPRWEAAEVVDRLGVPPQQTVAQYLDEHLALAVPELATEEAH